MYKILTFSIKDSTLYKTSLNIREKVFVEEQNVARKLEVENEDEATFYLLLIDEIAVGTGRWRKTKSGIKLERFAILPEYRNKNLGTVLLKKVLADLEQQTEKIYLHSQLKAIPYYERQGFKKVGDMFVEAGIKHVEMIKSLNRMEK